MNFFPDPCSLGGVLAAAGEGLPSPTAGKKSFCIFIPLMKASRGLRGSGVRGQSASAGASP